MKCAKCGAELEDGVLFCRECGAKVEIPRKRFCRECGAPLADGVKFCSECGAKIDLIVDSPVSASITNTIESSDQGKTDNDNPAEAEKKKTAHNVDSIKERAAKFAKEVDLPNADKIKEKATKFAKQVDLPKAKGNVKKYLIIAVVAIILIAAIGSRIGKSSTSRSSTNSNNTPRSAETTTVPESKIPVVAVTDMSYPEAVEALKAAGFSNVTSNIEPNTDESQWVVVKQSVDPGKKIRPGDKIELTCAMRCKLYIDIHSEANLMFSTYDITVSLDGTELGSIPNGKNFTLLADILSGDHTLVFCKAGSTSPKATKKISVANDVTYSCDLAHSGSSIDIKNESIQDNINGAALEVIDVTGMVLSDAMAKLSEIGFSNLREEPYSSIWDKDNWIVTAQGIQPGTVADKNDFIQLDCISLDDYFSNTYVGKNVSEIQELAEASGFVIRFEDDSWHDLNSTVAAMDQQTKADWIATSARQYGGADKTAVVTIKNTNPAAVPVTTPKPTAKPAENKYDIDKDLVVVQCERDAEKTSMYHVTFAEVDSSGNPTTYYTFGSIINPRAMGKQFNAIGDLPSWFYVGATVHVKANLIGGELSQSDCSVTEATGTSSPTPTATSKPEDNSMPVMSGTSLDSVLNAAKAFGLSRAFSDESFGHGTKMCSLTSSNGGLTLDIIYSTSTKEVLCGTIVTFNTLSSTEDQKAFIRAMSSVLCPESDQSDVTSWVNSNVGGTAETTIGGFVYEVSLGPSGNCLYSAGESNWAEWDLSLS